MNEQETLLSYLREKLGEGFKIKRNGENQLLVYRYVTAKFSILLATISLVKDEYELALSPTSDLRTDTSYSLASYQSKIIEALYSYSI